jgi:hypothetical protein
MGERKGFEQAKGFGLALFVRNGVPFSEGSHDDCLGASQPWPRRMLRDWNGKRILRERSERRLLHFPNNMNIVRRSGTACFGTACLWVGFFNAGSKLN